MASSTEVSLGRAQMDMDQFNDVIPGREAQNYFQVYRSLESDRCPRLAREVTRVDEISLMPS